MRNRLLDVLTVLTAACAVLLTGMVVWDRIGGARAGRESETESIPDWETYAAVGHRYGNPRARVTIVEFGDYQCPACRSFQGPLDAVMTAMDTTLVALVYRHYPLNYHPLAYTAARAAECAANQGRFREYHQLLYENSSWLAIGSRAFEEYGVAVAIPDSSRFADCLYSHEKVTAIEQDISAGDRLGRRGVPTIMINDRLVVNSVPDSAALIALIRKALTDSSAKN